MFEYGKYILGTAVKELEGKIQDYKGAKYRIENRSTPPLLSRLLTNCSQACQANDELAGWSSLV